MTERKRPKMAHSQRTMSVLQAQSYDLILKSRELPRTGRPEESDYIDVEIIDQVLKVGGNALLVTTGSCSGHDGYPFLSVVFKDERARNYYCRKARAAGISAVNSDAFRLEFFEQDPRLRVKEEWNFGFFRKCSQAQSERFWKTIVSLFWKLPREVTRSL
jgi:hypothetical protein